MDVGQPPDFLIGTNLFLTWLRKTSPEKLSGPVEGSEIIGDVLLVRKPHSLDLARLQYSRLVWAQLPHDAGPDNKNREALQDRAERCAWAQCGGRRRCAVCDTC
jgi:hypothetical protein